MALRTLAVGIMFLSLTGNGISVFGQPNGMKPHQHDADPVLGPGQYSAKVAALVCQGCRPLIEKTMRGVQGIESATVNEQTSRVDFAVKKGSSVKWSSLQTTLRASAQQMGMGADYTLSDFKIVSANTGSPKAAEQTLSAGYYTAKVGAIVCSGCKPLIEKTMRQVPGIGAAQVDEKDASVKFAVMKGKRVSFTELQKALNDSAKQMGMGADYELYDLKPLKKRT